MCQILNIWHISHTKHKEQLPSYVAYVPKLYYLCSYCCKFATVRTDVVKQNNIFYLVFSFLSLLILNEQLIPNIQEHINQAKQQHPTLTDKNPIGKRWKQSKPSPHIPQIHTKKRKKSFKKIETDMGFSPTEELQLRGEHKKGLRIHQRIHKH